MMGWQEQQRERYKQQQAEKARAEQQEAEQQRLLLKSQFEEQQRIAAEQSAVRERQAEKKLRIEKQQLDEASQRLADGLKLLDAQRQERQRLAREKIKARKMPASQTASVSKKGLRAVKQDNPGFFRDPIWQFIGTAIAFLALVLSLLIWFVPNHNDLFTHNQSAPITSATITLTATSTLQHVKSNTSSLSDYIPNTDYIPNALVRNIICIFFGIVLGFLTSLLLRGRYGLIGDMIIGIVGAYVGYLFISLLFPASSLLAFGAIVFIGSCLALFFSTTFNKVHKQTKDMTR